MILTDKCKEDFEIYLEGWIILSIAWATEKPTKEDVEHFYSFPYEMQYGVYVDFFDSVEISIDIHPVYDYNMNYYTDIIDFLVYVRKLNIENDVDPIECKTRQEAREQAITKANKIYNESK